MADHVLDRGPDEVRVDADATDPAELEEREEQLVVARVELEPQIDDLPRLLQVVPRLLDPHDADAGQLRECLDVDLDPRADRDVVGQDRLVGRGGDLLEVLHDAARRRARVVRRDDEEAVHAEVVRLAGQRDRVPRVVRPGRGDDARPLPHLVDGSA